MTTIIDEDLESRVHPLAYLTIGIASLAIAIFVLIIGISWNTTSPPSLCVGPIESLLTHSPSILCFGLELPFAFSIVAIILGVISRISSNRMGSKRSQRWSDIGLTLAIISFIITTPCFAYNI